MINSYQDLEVWTRAIELAVSSYQLSQRWPAHEKFGLTSQIRRASVSIAANIAEGHGRAYRKDFVRHLSIARGSLKEVETHLIIGQRLGYLESSELDLILATTQVLGRKLTTLRKRLDTSK